MTLLILLLVIAWCGGMSTSLALVKWLDGNNWRRDAAYAVGALLLLFIWSFK
jgi:hypothetical protein